MWCARTWQLIRAVQRHRHHRPRVRTDAVLGLVRQSRAPFFNFRNPRIPFRWVL